MAPVLAKTLLQSAIATGDWLLTCQKIRNPERYSEIFNKLFSSFQENLDNAEIYERFLTVLDDVFDILKEAQEKGSIRASTALDPKADLTIEVEKTFSELLREAEDFFMFLFIFANVLDTTWERKETPSICHAYNIIKYLIKIPVTSDNDCQQSFCDFRLKVMMSGFNVIPIDSPFHHQACLDIVKFATKCHLFERLIPYLDCIKQWIETNSFITSCERCEFYRIIVDHFEKEDKMDENIFKILKLTIKELDKDPKALNHKVSVQSAVQLLTLAIKLPNIIAFNELVMSPTVQQLKSESHVPLLLLATIFYNGDHIDFQNFAKTYPDFFTHYNIDYESCFNKIKLLVLTSMACECKSDYQEKTPSLSLKQVSEQLQISIEQTESLAIQAINLGLINGKIDQINSLLVVRSSFYRVFERLQWVQLGEHLLRLAQNVSALLAKVDKTSKLV